MTYSDLFNFLSLLKIKDTQKIFWLSVSEALDIEDNEEEYLLLFYFLM